MEFTVIGRYWDDEAVITWADGRLSGTPADVVDRLKDLHKRDVMILGGQPFEFDLTEFESAYLFLARYYVDKPMIKGDKPEELEDVTY